MIKIISAPFLLLLIVQHASAQEDDYSSFFTAYQNKEYKKALPYGERLLKDYDHHSISMMVAEAYAQSGQPKKTMAILVQLAKRGLPYDISQNPHFQSLATQPGYPELVKVFGANAKPVHASTDAFQLSDASLIPENIAYHDGSFYIGSLSQCKIVKYKDGVETDFFRHDSLWSVVGMKIDPDSNSIWVCTFSEKAPDSGYSGIFNIDLKTGKPLGIFVKKPDEGHFAQGAHLFNDLVVTGAKVYFTDSKRRNVYVLDKKSFTVDILIQGGFIYTNGIAIDEKGENLFIACSRGLTRFNVVSKKRTRLQHNGISITNDIDGLYYYKGTLIGVQGITGKNDDRIVQFYLDKEQNGIEKVTVLQTWQPDFNLPTTGVICGDRFYYIANSFVNRLNPDNSLKDSSSIQKPIIKVLSLE